MSPQMQKLLFGDNIADRINNIVTNNRAMQKIGKAESPKYWNRFSKNPDKRKRVYYNRNQNQPYYQQQGYRKNRRNPGKNLNHPNQKQ